MSRLRGLFLVGLLTALVTASAASGQRAQPVLRTPNPLLSSVTLDYVSPIPSPTGGFAMLDPLRRQAIKASVRDLKFLEYEKRDDLGGFIAAPTGWLAIGYCPPHHSGSACPGIRINKGRLGPTGVPFYSPNQLKDRINSYTWLHGFPNGNGGKTCAACGIVGPPGLFGNGGSLPPPNGCFSGCSTAGGGGGGNGGTTGTGTTKSGGGSGGGGGGSPSPGDCGTAGISIVSNLKRCRIYVVNQAPGDGTAEKMTITNTSESSYVLSLRATGVENALWDDLQMGVWQQGTTPPDPLPPLHFWTNGFNRLITLEPRQTVHLTIELYLPVFAGNADQHLAAVVDFDWRAVGKPSS